MKTAQRRAEPRWWKGIVGLFAAVIVTLTVAGPAMASTTASSDVALASATTGVNTSLNTGLVSTRVIEPTEGGASTPRGVCTATVDAEGQLPVTRWDEGTEFHDRLHGNRPGDIAKRLQRQGMVSFMFGVGNTAWATTTGMTEMAVNFCVLDKVGGVVDNTAADLGQAMLSSGIVAILVVASVCVFLWRVGRSQGGGANTSALLQKGVVLGMLAVMIAGASASTGGGASRNPNDPYKPGFGAPGWFITTIDQVVATSASLLAGSVESQAIDGAEKGPAGRASLGCAPYVKAMKQIYRDKQGTEFGSASAATVPLLLSSMWETSGLEMWKKAQFGTQNIGTHNNKTYGYGDLMYCRMLEANVAAKRWPTTTYYDDSVSSIMKKTGALDKETFGVKIADSGTEREIPGYQAAATWHTNGENLAWRYSSSNKVRDRFYIAWAACSAPMVSGEGNDPGADLVHKDEASDTDLRENCAKFLTEADWDGGGGTDEFDWDESDDDISDTTTSDSAQDFMLTLHGSRQSSGLVAGMVYMMSSILVAGVFILLSCAIMVAKVSALMMMLGMIFVLVLALAPNTSMRKIGDYAKQYLGLSLFAWGATLIMSVLALITAILINAGNQVVPGGPGDVMAIAWVGFAPLIAVFCLHFIFKKLRIPSPLKMSGGMAWGQMAASGAVGGAVGMGAGALVNRAGNRMKARATDKGRDIKSAVTGKDRKGRMTPGGGTNPNPTGTGNGRRSKVSSDTETPETNETTGTKPDLIPGAASAGKTSLPAAGTKPEDMTGSEKRAMKSAGKAERRDAKEFAKTDEGKAEIAKAVGSRAQRARATAGSAVTSAARQFKDKPLATTKKAAMVGTGAVLLGAATGGVGLAAGAGMYAAKRHMTQTRPERSAAMLRGEATNSAVEALRTNRARQNEQRVAAEQASMGRAYEANKANEAANGLTDEQREANKVRTATRLGPTSPNAQANGQAVTDPNAGGRGKRAAAAEAKPVTQAAPKGQRAAQAQPTSGPAPQEPVTVPPNAAERKQAPAGNQAPTPAAPRQ